MKFKTLFPLAALAAAALVAGCASNVKLDETPVESRTPTPVAAQTVQPTTPARSTGTSIPFRAEKRTRRSATGSPPSSRGFWNSMFPPISTSVV